MESEFLYRYIGFEAFVGMVQKKALTFVLPSVWDDPQEESPFFQMVEKKESMLQRALHIAAHNKVYAQSWSELSESDAMWRIYAYNNKAVRIKAAKDRISLLEGVSAVPVTYSNEEFNYEELNEETFLSSMAYKRTAFSHEKEVRLIKRYRYRDQEDAELHIKALMVVSEHPQFVEIIDSMYPGMPVEEKVREISKILNIGIEEKKTKDISYAHIPDFIEGVMVHPLAPRWYVEVVQEYCNRNNIPFEGQSELYRVME
jgi:hypothetical protein